MTVSLHIPHLQSVALSLKGRQNWIPILNVPDFVLDVKLHQEESKCSLLPRILNAHERGLEVIQIIDNVYIELESKQCGRVQLLWEVEGKVKSERQSVETWKTNS